MGVSNLINLWGELHHFILWNVAFKLYDDYIIDNIFGLKDFECSLFNSAQYTFKKYKRKMSGKKKQLFKIIILGDSG